MKPVRKREVLLTAVGLVLVAFFCFVVPRFVIGRFVIEGESMEATLADKDSVLVEKVSGYTKKFDRFDVVVLFPTEEAKKQGERYYVKRIVGLPGETVQILYDMVYINGLPLVEEYGSSEMDHAGIAKDPVLLGEGEYFVLGDNRKISEDSRSEKIGPVPEDRIAGKVVFRIFPLKRIGFVR